MPQNEFRFDTYCGGFCGACPQFIATESGTVDAFAAQNNKTPGEVICYGCKSDVLCGWCKICPLKKCAESRGLEFCGDCNEYPCDVLQRHIDNPDYPYHSLVPQQMADIRAMGVDAWLAGQDRRWRCPTCNARFSWFDSTCPNCGAKTRSWSE
ncbi:MAG: DUF3795 domain-containing protein [Anaerolineae bacterium]|nr:DUF3795 domain-containing protein [Anaerolineae bacterium]